MSPMLVSVWQSDDCADHANKTARLPHAPSGKLGNHIHKLNGHKWYRM